MAYVAREAKGGGQGGKEEARACVRTLRSVPCRARISPSAEPAAGSGSTSDKPKTCPSLSFSTTASSESAAPTAQASERARARWTSQSAQR